MKENEAYFCTKCMQFVTPVPASFQHPDMGRLPCKGCPKCYQMIYVKKRGELNHA